MRIDKRSLSAIAILLLVAMWPGNSPATSAVAASSEPGWTLQVEGDSIRSLVESPPGATAIFVAGERDLYRSNNQGRTWEVVGPVSDFSVIISNFEGDTLLAGDRPGCRSGEEPTSLNRSEDGGRVWQPVPGASGIRPEAIFAGSGVVIGATCRSVVVSEDRGLSWEAIDLPDTNLDISAIAPLSSEPGMADAALVVGTSEGGSSRLWRLDLNDPAKPHFSAPLLEFWGSGALAGQGDRLVVGSAVGVHVSTDGGLTWQVNRTGLEATTVSGDPEREGVSAEESKRGYGLFAVAIDPGDPLHLWAGGTDGLYESADFGSTWQRLSEIDDLVERIYLPGQSEYLIVQTEQGVMLAFTRE